MKYHFVGLTCYARPSMLAKMVESLPSLTLHCGGDTKVNIIALLNVPPLEFKRRVDHPAVANQKMRAEWRKEFPTVAEAIDVIVLTDGEPDVMLDFKHAFGLITVKQITGIQDPERMVIYKATRDKGKE